MTFRAPFISYTQAGKYAKKFLEKHHPSLELPIPIEWIIESDLKLHIFPMPNLYRMFGQNGFLSRNRNIIYVDEYQYDNFVEKYRFTLAHEVGHFVMHKAFYEGLSFESEQEYIEWLQSLPPKELHWFETHADWFADQLLVPSGTLENCCVELLESNRDRFSDDKPLSHEFWSYASNELAEPFEVNPIVIEIRIRRENLSEKFKHYYHKY